ncbi:hypothetical protein BDQ17DRAFT_1420607 [Cyathus striatus]|nr:hypothetical protein BDQ17DRAFT_1420607 [Cyathus striatus]
MRSKEVGAGNFVATSFLSLFSCTLYTSSLMTVVLNEPKYKSLPYYPNAFLTTLFAVAQVLLQLYWLALLVRTVGKKKALHETAISSTTDEEAVYLEDDGSETFYPESSQFSYAPFYIVGNFLLASWGALWIRGSYIPSILCLFFNSIIQLVAVLLMARPAKPIAFTADNYATHAVGRTCIGLTFLLMWKTWAVIAADEPPSVSQLIASCLIFLLFVDTGPDPTVPLCLLYDLLSLIFGEGKVKIWQTAFIVFFGMIALSIVFEHLSLLRQWSCNILGCIYSLQSRWKCRKPARGITIPTPGSRRFTDDDDEELPMLPFELSIEDKN